MEVLETEILDELEKITSETDLKIHELSRMKEALQELVGDIQSLENRFELIKRALASISKAPRQHVEAQINV